MSFLQRYQRLSSCTQQNTQYVAFHCYFLFSCISVLFNYFNQFSYEVGYSSVIAVSHSVRHFVTPSIRILCVAIEQKLFDPQPCYFTYVWTPRRRKADQILGTRWRHLQFQNGLQNIMSPISQRLNKRITITITNKAQDLIFGRDIFLS